MSCVTLQMKEGAHDVCSTTPEIQCLYRVPDNRGMSVSLFIIMVCPTKEKSQCHYSYGVSHYGGKSVSLFIMVCLNMEENQFHYSYGVSDYG